MAIPKKMIKVNGRLFEAPRDSLEALRRISDKHGYKMAPAFEKLIFETNALKELDELFVAEKRKK